MPSVEITSRYEHRYPNGAMKTFMPGTHHDQPSNVIEGAERKGKGHRVESPGPVETYPATPETPPSPARRRRKAKGGTDGE